MMRMLVRILVIMRECKALKREAMWMMSASEDTGDNESVSGSEKRAMWMMRMLVRILMIMRRVRL